MPTLTYEEALARLERWQSGKMSDDEKIDFLQTAIDDLKDPQNIAEFKANISDLATAAVNTDEAFDKVNRTLKDFVRDYGSQFPEMNGYQQRWEGYKNRWTSLIWTSRDFASKTSASYKEYDQIFLQMVEKVKTKEDMADAAEALNRYSQQLPTDIPPDFSQQFLDLRRDVEEFQKDFKQYCKDKGTELEREAELLRDDINTLETQIEELDKKVKDATLALEIAAWWGLVGAAIAGSVLAAFTKQRNDKKKELADKQAKLEEVNKKQVALAHIQSTFDGLDPDIKLICDTLNLFSTTWAGFHSEALQFSDILKKLPDTQYPLEFRLRVQLARETASPLQQSLEEYATKIHNGVFHKISA